jgi:hypothetical protein
MGISRTSDFVPVFTVPSKNKNGTANIYLIVLLTQKTKLLCWWPITIYQFPGTVWKVTIDSP